MGSDDSHHPHRRHHTAASSLKRVCGVVLGALVLLHWKGGGGGARGVSSWLRHDEEDDSLESGGTGTGTGTTSAAADFAGNSVKDENREAPYGDFCETRPRGEKEPWNVRKKVIAFSLFLPQGHPPGQEIPQYLLGGVEANVRLAKLFYPEWIVRLYVLNLSDEQIDEILQLDTKTLEIVKCHDDSPLNKLDNARKMMTRFLVLDDPTVEYGMIRDLDSRPSIRELLAVNEWISSALGFHTLRDHAQHSIPIMGGVFGAKKGTIDMTATVKRALQDHPTSRVPGCCADDQNFLSTYVWGQVRDNAIDHDMQPGRCRSYGAKVCRSFPLTSRDDRKMFVGQPFKNDEPYLGTRDTHYACSVDCQNSNDEWYTDMATSNF